MKRFLIALVLVSAGAAFGQVKLEIQLPTISFPAPPQLVVVSPGVQVVEDNDEEVFFVDSWYWHRTGPNWFRTKTHGGGWVVVEPALVPRTIVSMPVGKDRRFKHEVREERHEDRREDRHEDKHEDKHEEHKAKKNKH